MTTYIFCLVTMTVLLLVSPSSHLCLLHICLNKKKGHEVIKNHRDGAAGCVQEDSTARIEEMESG